jgi:hypothetical protein
VFAFVVAGNRGGLGTVASWQFAEEMIDRLSALASDVLQKDKARLFSTTKEVG